jgi:hypothetical protein
MRPARHTSCSLSRCAAVLLALVQAKVALVTRNTTQSVDAFFGLVGEEWRGLFSEIRTREFKYVKPDKRLLLELAEVGVGVWVCLDTGTASHHKISQ